MGGLGAQYKTSRWPAKSWVGPRWESKWHCPWVDRKPRCFSIPSNGRQLGPADWRSSPKDRDICKSWKGGIANHTVVKNKNLEFSGNHAVAWRILSHAFQSVQRLCEIYRERAKSEKSANISMVKEMIGKGWRRRANKKVRHVRLCHFGWEGNCSSQNKWDISIITPFNPTWRSDLSRIWLPCHSWDGESVRPSRNRGKSTASPFSELISRRAKNRPRAPS